jgi:acyl phosphate:glycerol-3-phosphate acyltransferase
MQEWYVAAVLVLSYILGAVPYGYLITKLTTGKDVRRFESGRTGTTNTMRVAGIKAAIITIIMDALKGIAAVWVAHMLVPDLIWVHVVAPIVAVIGHNYSIFMLEHDSSGHVHLRGGAGGVTGAGGLIGLWWPSIFYIIPIGFALWFGVGYASLATLSIGIIAVVIFTYRALFENAAWTYVLYGLLLEIVVIWALRPNIKRLIDGTERLVGWRAKRQKSLSTTSNK